MPFSIGKNINSLARINFSPCVWELIRVAFGFQNTCALAEAAKAARTARRKRAAVFIVFFSRGCLGPQWWIVPRKETAYIRGT